jgi:hypothetical protein
MDMAALRRSLEAAGYKVVVDARIILVVRDEAGVESSLYDNGQVLLKTPDRDLAEAAYARLEPVLGAAQR